MYEDMIVSIGGIEHVLKRDGNDYKLTKLDRRVSKMSGVNKVSVTLEMDGIDIIKQQLNDIEQQLDRILGKKKQLDKAGIRGGTTTAGTTRPMQTGVTVANGFTEIQSLEIVKEHGVNIGKSNPIN